MRIAYVLNGEDLEASVRILAHALPAYRERARPGTDRGSGRSGGALRAVARILTWSLLPLGALALLAWGLAVLSDAALEHGRERLLGRPSRGRGGGVRPGLALARDRGAGGGRARPGPGA